MAKRSLQTAPSPVERAMVFVCQKCGKRAGGPHREASYELAANLKRATKREFEKREVRVVLTSCMKLCPPDAITVFLQMQQAHGRSAFLQADLDDPESASEELLERIKGT